MNTLGQKTILLVEADALLLANSEATLKKLGYDVLTANTGTTAVAIAADTIHIDLIVMDIDHAHEIDGAETSRQILEQRDIPIIYHGSLSQQESAVNVWNTTGYGYILKNSCDLVLQSSIKIALDLFETNEKLRACEYRYQRIIQGLTDYLYTVRIENGRPVETIHSTACEIVTGYSAGEYAADPYLWLRMIKEEDRDQVVQRLEHIISEKQAPPIEHRIVRKDGQVRWVSDIILPFIDSRGNLLSYDGIVKDITERKRDQEARRESENRFSMFMDYLPAIVFIKDNEGRTVFVNKYMDNAMHASEWIGKTMIEIFPNEFGAKLLADDMRVLKMGYQKIEETIPHLDGTLHHYETQKFIINRPGLEPLLGGIALDITERKKTLDALEESEIKFRALFEKGPIGVAYHNMIYDEAGTSIDYFFLDANERYQELTGVDPRGKTVREAFPGIENDPFNWIGTFGKVAQTGEDIRFESYLESNDRWYDVVGYQYKPDHFVAAFLEITERKRSELLLAQERERLSVTLRSIGDGVITTNTSGTIVMVNKVAEEMTGWKTEEAAGRPLQEVFIIVNELTRVPCENPIEKVLSSGSIVELANHTCLIAKDGREIQIADSAAPIRDSKSQITGVVLVFRDMTEKQKLNESLARAQKLESLGILAGGIAHDFNNMLAGIFGYLDIAKESFAVNKIDRVPKYLDKALGVFDRAKGLTQQLLTFSKGGTPVRKTTLIAPLVQHSANFALSGSNVTCHFNFADGLWLCDCDENQIGQAVDNIVINAKQSMPMGGTIVVSAVNTQDEPGHPGHYVRISVKDSGIGMTAEVLPKIFDPFFSTKITGHGLGLPTVFSIMQRHDGWVEVESKPDAGTTFHLFIPASHKKEFCGVEGNVQEHKGTGTILVMDDEEYLLEIVENMLQEMGYTVAQAKDGSEALALFSKAESSGHPFTACILDLTIPGGKGGKTIALDMRAARPNAIIIASSGYSEDPVIANPTAFGFTGRIIKPYRKNELMQLLAKVMPT